MQMINIGDDTILIGMTELRTELPKLSKQLKVKKIIITKRGKPVTILEDYEKYQEKEALIENLEDLVLGNIALERSKNSTEKDYISHEELKRLLGHA